MGKWCVACGFILALIMASQLRYKGVALAQQQNAISYAFVYSGGGAGGFNSSGSLPAVELAEDMIRANDTILPGYNFTHTAALDSECDRTASIDQFFQSVPSSDPPVLALLGSGCSVATEPVAEIIHHWNISQISYSSASISLDDRSRFRSFFRTYPSLASFVPAIRSVIEFYGWKRIMFLTQEESLFTRTYSLLRDEITASTLNITVENLRIPSGSPIQLPPDLFNQGEDFRVFYINSYSGIGRAIICEAAKQGLTYPRYAWLTYGWYQDRWWTGAVDSSMVDCTDQQLEMFLERALALQIFPSSEDPTAHTDTGLTANEFSMLYNERLNRSSFAFTHVSTLAYDATWALAIALDRTARMVNLSETEVELMTNCSAAGPGSGLVPLEDFTYANSFMGCVIQWNLAQTNFMGVSGPVLFDASGSRVQIRVAVRQYRNIDSSLERVKFGLIDSVNDNRLNYIKNETNLTVYPNGIPPDGTPINTTVTYHLALVISFDILAIFGILFTTVCLVFNFAYRNKKIVRLTSPKLNYFIILGCYLIFISVFLGPIPTIDPRVFEAQCHLQNWLVVVGYTLAFSTILSKMVRVFHIFNNPTAKKQKLNDWHLVIIIVGLTSFAVLLLIIGSAVPQLRPAPGLSRNDENSIGMNELGVRIDYFALTCYANSAFYWVIVTFAYLVILQIIGFILAVQTRKVKIKALNDSKFVAAIIYVTSIVLMLVIVVTFALYNYRNIAELVFNGALMLGTVAVLCLIFVPKMVSLYRDPQGKNVFDKSQPTSTIEIGKSGAIAIKNKSAADDTIQQLESRIKELELMVANGDGRPRSCDVRFQLTTSQQSPASDDTFVESKNSGPQNDGPVNTDSL